MPNKSLKILFIGDIVGKPGRKAVTNYLLEHKANYDYVFANGENVSSGKGITYGKYLELIEAGVDYFTTGNHISGSKEILPRLDKEQLRILRPQNYPLTFPGIGTAAIDDDLILVNLEGRVFMKEEPVKTDPLAVAKQIADQYKDKIIIIDFHAEATSEKIALGHYLDGKVSAVLGTHTHVQTADETILQNGTAYITDLGMTGPSDSVLGVKKEIIIDKFLTQSQKSHKVASGDSIFCAVELEINKTTKKAIKIKRINKKLNISTHLGR